MRACRASGAEEFYRLIDGIVIDDAEFFNDELREWERRERQARVQRDLVSCTWWALRDSNPRPPPCK